MVRFEPAHVGQLLNYGGQEHLIAHVRERDLIDLAQGRFAFTAIDGDMLLGSGGLIEVTAYRAAAWALLARQSSPRTFIAIHRLVRRVIAQSGFKRVEAFVDPKSHAAMRWAKALGFTLERAYLPLHFPDGSGAAHFAIHPEA